MMKKENATLSGYMSDAKQLVEADRKRQLMRLLMHHEDILDAAYESPHHIPKLQITDIRYDNEDKIVSTPQPKYSNAA